MKLSQTIKITLVITILFELTLMMLTYKHVGFERFIPQILRLFIQILLFTGILLQNFKSAAVLLSAYHIFLVIISYNKGFEVVFILLVAYHFMLGITILFHEWIDTNLFKNANDGRKK